MKIIAVSGTPGTGKTTLSKNLAKMLNFLYLDVNKIILKHKLSEGYDIKRKTRIVDTSKLNKFIVKEISLFKKNIKEKNNKHQTINLKPNKKFPKKKIFVGLIIDSHLSHYLPKKCVDLCIVTKCSIKELNKRLKRKKFHKQKIQENLQAEIFDVCYNEALERKHNIISVDTTKGFNISDIMKKVK